jgi:hypothetical protein
MVTTRLSLASSIQPIPTLRIWLIDNCELESHAIYSNVNKLYKRFNDDDEFASYFFSITEWDAVVHDQLDGDFIRFVIKIVVDKMSLRNGFIKLFLKNKSDSSLYRMGITRYFKQNSGPYYRIITGDSTY